MRTIKIQPEKIGFLAKKIRFFFNFLIFHLMLEDPIKFLMLNFLTLSKKNSKMACLAPVWYQKEQSHEFW